MTETLTIEEINQRYPDEWVLMGDPETDEEQRLLRGQVLCHSKDRQQVYDEAQRTTCTHIATHFTGTVPDDMVRVL
ncbi:MAG: hypothetical protein ACE5KM_12245 [Planctomycetaceae bacterium]